MGRRAHRAHSPIRALLKAFGLFDARSKDHGDERAERERQLAVALQVRNAAIVARDQARRERDEARTRAHEGDVGDVDLRSYCECCDRYWHRNYVTWFERPVTTDTGRTISSACGACFERVPELDPVH